MKKFIFIPLFLLIVLIAFTSCKKSGNENYVVKFKGGGLTTLDLDAHYTNLKKSRTFKNKPEELTSELVFDHALNMEMIITKGLDEKLHLDPRIRARIHEFMADLFLKVMQESLVPQINKDDFTKEELNTFYNAHKDNYKTKAIYNVKMIKTKTSEPAWAAMKKIKFGQSDFSGAAAEYSIDKESKNREGDIGSRALSKFRKDWQPVIASLETNTVSGPHKIRDAYYIFKLINKTQPRQHSFEEKKPYIKNDLLYTKYKEEWEKTYNRL
ncbi:MAG: peptidyl-prolyl cis-trans isomerase, partial [Desulfobacula sp.]|nr:peptidyl-prolyl cis-trans isomerase [Desulfobacula sp.]